jgi:hypothetical protein
MPQVRRRCRVRSTLHVARLHRHHRVYEHSLQLGRGLYGSVATRLRLRGRDGRVRMLRPLSIAGWLGRPIASCGPR